MKLSDLAKLQRAVLSKRIAQRAKTAPKTAKKSTKAIPATREPDFFCRLVLSQLGLEVIREHRFHATRKWRFDYAIEAHKVALEVEGGVWSQGRHTRPKGFLGDMEKYNQAAAQGWRVIRTTPGKLLKTETMEMLREITKATKQF